MSNFARVIPQNVEEVRNRRKGKMSWGVSAGVELYVGTQKCSSFAVVLVLPKRSLWYSAKCEVFIGHFSQKLSQTCLW